MEKSLETGFCTPPSYLAPNVFLRSHDSFLTGKGDMNVPLLNGFENGVNSGPESDKDKKYNSQNQKDATSGNAFYSCQD